MRFVIGCLDDPLRLERPYVAREYVSADVSSVLWSTYLVGGVLSSSSVVCTPSMESLRGRAELSIGLLEATSSRDSQVGFDLGGDRDRVSDAPRGAISYLGDREEV